MRSGFQGWPPQLASLRGRRLLACELAQALSHGEIGLAVSERLLEPLLTATVQTNRVAAPHQTCADDSDAADIGRLHIPPRLSAYR
jgi:hypothetical protein